MNARNTKRTFLHSALYLELEYILLQNKYLLDINYSLVYSITQDYIDTIK